MLAVELAGLVLMAVGAAGLVAIAVRFRRA